jgi:lactoylglutathione lyase
MIRVLDLDRSISFYREAFRLEEGDRVDFEHFTLVYLSNDESDFEVELTFNKGQTEPYDLGNGYGHLAVSVDDVESEHQRFGEASFEQRRLVTRRSASSSSLRTPTGTRSRSCREAGASSRRPRPQGGRLKAYGEGT